MTEMKKNKAELSDDPVNIGCISEFITENTVDHLEFPPEVFEQKKDIK